MAEQCASGNHWKLAQRTRVPLRKLWFTRVLAAGASGDMGTEKVDRSDGFLEFLGSAKRNLLAGLDLDGLASRWVASHAGGAMSDLQDAQAD
jgi:hypothetical protein